MKGKYCDHCLDPNVQSLCFHLVLLQKTDYNKIRHTYVGDDSYVFVLIGPISFFITYTPSWHHSPWQENYNYSITVN